MSTDGGLNEAVENFVHEMQDHRFHAWEGVICREQGIPLTAEQERAADGLICEWFQVDVDWDNGRSLMISVPPDEYEVITESG